MSARFPIVLLIFSLTLGAHDPISTKLTWSREVSRLVQRRCASCHRPGGAAMSLLTYAEARPWAVAISEEVLSRRMPPWGAVKGFGEFRDDLSLTQEEVGLFADWVAGGAPEGEPAYLPPPFQAAGHPAAAPASRQRRIEGRFVVPEGLQLLAIRPDAVAPGANVRLVARRPDGSVEPLLWLRDFQPAFSRTYTLAPPLALPAGARIEVTPPAAGSFLVFYTSGLRSHR